MFPALLLASYWGGSVGGAACLLLSLAGAWYFFVGPPRTFALAPHEGAGLFVLFCSGAAIVAGTIALRRLVQRLRDAHEVERLLARELQHRVRNNLAVIEALAVESARGAEDVQAFLERFLGRMQSLSAAQTLLARNNAPALAVEDIMAAVAAPFQAHGRLSWGGDRLELTGHQATMLALCLHELATNSIKYGALSSEAGTVRIDWSDCGGRLGRICWREAGGPPPRPPERTGSGDRLLRRGLDPERPAEIAYGCDGLVWSAEFRPARR